MSKLSWISASVVINCKAALSDSYPSESSVPAFGHLLASKISKTDSAMRAHYKLYWLPVRVRIEYKILLLVFKCLNYMAPKYLENLLSINNREGIPRNLCSNKAVILMVPYVKNMQAPLVCKDPSGGTDCQIHCRIKKL